MQVDMRLERELDIWKQLDHHNIVCLQKVLDTDHATFLICDYCPGGSLLDLLNKKSLTESEARRIFVQLCDAIRYLHEDAKVCHKDLKLENILLQDNDHVKLCDFGLAMCQQPLKINPVTHLPLSPDLSDSDDNCAGGSLAYAAPEQIKSTKAIGCPSTDIWSLGVILYALVTGKLPYSDNYDLRLQQKILHGEFEMPTFVSPELQLLLRHCLESDPQKRYTIQHILQSSWCTAL
ncbi:kinase-like domain-containing protein [Gilbertella persicaria]|nr:kinase-like domain-containing protein [Gilbertella persicaria]KAI8091437.1 kinase-like domain-containing protein [Gilbertella persicaria]